MGTPKWSARWCDLSFLDHIGRHLEFRDEKMPDGVGEAGLVFTNSSGLKIGFKIQASSAWNDENRIVEGPSEDIFIVIYCRSVFRVVLAPELRLDRLDIYPCRTKILRIAGCVVVCDDTRCGVIYYDGDIKYYRDREWEILDIRVSRKVNNVDIDLESSLSLTKTISLNVVNFDVTL